MNIFKLNKFSWWKNKTTRLILDKKCIFSNEQHRISKSEYNLVNLIQVRKLSSRNEAEIRRIRNIGVIAHVDAGKTTTTERMLYYSGFTNSLGNVDDGNTVMDYMEQERERGITITSAAITFPWKEHQFNLIDTPGHVDFTIEVERALRVLDGAIAIIDASAGVEAQTLTVWRQSNKYKIPRIAFINKMDKIGACFDKCLKSIEAKLNTIALPLQIPIGEERNFVGVLDLINMSQLTWNNAKSAKDFGKSFEVRKLSQNDSVYERALKSRVALVEKLAQVDEEFAEVLLEKYNLDYEKMNDLLLLETHLRKTNVSGLITPVLCGSSLRNMCVQPLMDAIIKYLPSPCDLEKNNFTKYYEKELNAFCFKIIHDHQKSRKRVNSATAIASLNAGGASSSLAKSKSEDVDSDILTYIRVYNGDLHAKSKVFNVSKQCRETIDKIYVPFSNQIKQVSKVSNGNIALVSGLTKSTTGDTLVTSKQAYDLVLQRLNADKNSNTSLMQVSSLEVAQPVYFCTVEPSSEAEEKRLAYALECLQREDPSLKVIHNDEENFGQTIIQGMGELHLEIIKDRVLKEYKLKAYFGPLNIAYKELPTKQVAESINFEKSLTDKKVNVQLGIEVIPCSAEYKFESVELVNKEENNLNEVTHEHLNAINHGVKSALNKGILLRYPIINTKVNVTKFVTNKNVLIPYISTAAYQCTLNALQKAECVLIQPVMQLEISTMKDYSHKVYSDLSRRNATNVKVEEKSQEVLITGKVPLSKLAHYSSELRRLTSGNTTFSIEFHSYEPLTQREYQELLEKKF